jgi:hypothetical protein
MEQKRARRAIAGMLRQYYEDCLRRVEPDAEDFLESAIRFAQQHEYAPPVQHHAGQ